MRISRRAVGIAVGIFAMAATAAGCSSSSATPTPKNSGGGSVASSTTALQSPTAEYLSLVTPVDAARADFEASSSTVMPATAAIFGQALQTWSRGLSSYSWPASAQGAISKIEQYIPPVVTGLSEIASKSIDYNQFLETYGTDGGRLSLASEAARRVLGLPPKT